MCVNQTTGQNATMKIVIQKRASTSHEGNERFGISAM
ncbi:MAG: hypothetical protein JWL83_747 [Actinomycetia bacterium]|nr:hypothetical protein [Actinomycetes bacterium]